MTLYRKYRPQKIDELDLENIRKRLASVLASGHTPHAFLFAGPKGTGKTSAARIVAKVINCEKVGKKRLEVKGVDRFKERFEPCNRCESCISITEGRNLDVLELDGASNRGIDEIRDLKEKIKLAPSSSLFKVYIIDEVHMLTTEAFNALLKTLEEPPAHAVFILATTEADKLLPTITSRCSRFDFQKATIDELVHSLKRVVKGEKLDIKNEKEVLESIAKVSDGSFRDGTKLLEQAIIEDALDPVKIEKVLGYSSEVSAKDVVELLVKKDAKSLLKLINKGIESGVNMKLLTASILTLLHDVLMTKHGLGGDNLSSIEKLSAEDINSLIKIFSRAYVEFRTSAIPQLPVEMAVVEWCETKDKNTVK